MGAALKTQQLQIRVTAREKAKIRQAAKAAGMSVSAWVLRQLWPGAGERFQGILSDLAAANQPSYALAALNDLLVSLMDSELHRELAEPPRVDLSPELANQVAAMVEYAAHRKGVAPPPWTAAVAPLQQPWFGSQLKAVRLHLLTHSPPPFRRRNIFVDASLGDRV